MEDQIKKLIELAINAGRKRLSPQTGFIHYCYHSIPEEVQYPIPIVENILFALALFRTRTAENVTEAKNHLDKLLAFQNLIDGPGYGNFPIYMHDFPECKDWYLGAHLLAPFYWILKDFGQVLGAELKARLENAAELLLSRCLITYAEKGGPDSIAIKIGAGLCALGGLFSEDYFKEGEQLLSRLMEPSEIWFQPRYLGDMLIAFQMMQTNESRGGWDAFRKHLQQTWHRETCAFAGPAFGEFQQGEEPQATLYDLYMGFFSGQYSARALKDSPMHLHAALIRPTEDKFEEMIYPFNLSGILKEKPWKMVMNKKYAYALIEQIIPFEPARDKGFCPLKVIWGSPQRVHTFVCQGGNSDRIKFHCFDNEIHLDFRMGAPVEVEDREKSREVAFYFDLFPETKILVEGESATTFKINEGIAIHMDQLEFKIDFESLNGEGQYLGHIMRGNRPSQVALKGENRFSAFDWQIFLRTLRRSGESIIKVKIALK